MIASAMLRSLKCILGSFSKCLFKKSDFELNHVVLASVNTKEQTIKKNSLTTTHSYSLLFAFEFVIGR